MNQTKLFQRNFTMVVIGQIISLFGNNMLRYALPLYLLNQTHSAGLFGIVTACSFIPMVVFAPIGGIVADRVNKRNVMVILDFSTAVLMVGFSILFQSVNLVVLSIAVLMLLYGIQGAYQPTVQSSIPLLVNTEQLMQGNAVINLVSSLAGLIGPVLGGVLFGFYGLKVILYISIICFICSAMMELFIQIPFKRQERSEGIWKMGAADMKESLRFITGEQKLLGKICILLAMINLVFSALIVIGVPIIINEHLGFSQTLGNQLYGYAEGGLAAGGLLGGLLAGIVGKRLVIQKSYLILLFCSLTLLPITLALMLPLPSMVVYLLIVVSCIVMMIFSTVFSIEMMVYGQQITPPHLLGKVMALISALVMCAHPVGQLLYGMLFEVVGDQIYLIFLFALAASIAISLMARRLIKKIPQSAEPEETLCQC